MNSSTTAATPRRLRAGIVGGGRGAFIGAVHRMAVELDGQALVIAGAMSADPAIAVASAADWYLERSYDSYVQMARAEGSLAHGIDFVIIAAPNHLHVPVAREFLAAGIHVACDKPLAVSLAEAQDFAGVAQESKALFALTHNYTGYPAVRQAREMIRAGDLGELRKVLVEYSQDWLMQPLESRGNKQAAWRTDPARAGAGGCVGDIGTHAANLLEFISGREIESLCADLTSFVAGRRLDDDAAILLRLGGGAKGTLVCSQIAAGEENRLSVRLYGSRAGLEWHQEEPNTLLYKVPGRPWERLRTGQVYLSPAARAASRLPPGHPEGYLEAFANLYRSLIEDIRRVQRGQAPLRDYPGAHEGVRGLRFVTQAVASSQAGGVWRDL
jgi:predicted dehydrogenase